MAAALTLVTVAGLALRLRDLAARSLWVDELFTVGLSAQSFPTVLRVLYGEEANMTLYYIVMFGWVRLVGAESDELWMRLPSVLFGALGALAIYRLGSRFGGRSVGLIAAALLAVNAYHVEMSQEARAYTLWALCITLSWDALVEALDDGTWTAWLRYVVWTALAFYAHFFSVFVIVAQCLVVAIRWRFGEWRVLALSGVAVAILCLPFVPFFLANSDGSQILHVRRSDLSDLVDLFRMFSGSTDPALIASLALGALGIAVTLWRIRVSASAAEIGRALVPLLWLLVPVLTVFLLSYVKPMFRERYLFGAMPALCVLAAIGLAAIRPVPLRLVAVAGLIAITLLPVFRGLTIRQDENWRAAVAYLEASAQPDDGWIFISKRAQLGYEYYADWLAGGRPGATRPDILESFDWGELADSQEYYRALTSGTSRLPEFSARHQRIWLVLSHEFDSTFDGDTSAAVRDWLTRRGYSARQRTFQNIRVLLYERRG
jgi:4-amino-4-deoxy-L-arabinose transferase-like glycosyltransferase